MNIFVRFMLVCGLLASSTVAAAQNRKLLQTAISLEIARPMVNGAVLHWKITNNLEFAVYVYDFYLWGPAYHVEHAGDKVTIETTPVTEKPGCPPNRFPPVLLLVVGPHRTIEGDFADAEITLNGKPVSFRISVGENPYTVVDAAKRFANSRCQHSPYDAIVRWGAIIESNTIRLPSR
jgi:hypothetical protein